MLMSAASYNFQLALKRLMAGEVHYDVYGFYRTTNLRPVGQVPDVFNTQLSIPQKKITLITYLRETIQRENMDFLGALPNRISDLEVDLMIHADAERTRARLLDRLDELYEHIHESPYAKVEKKFTYRAPKELHEEYYVRCTQQNLSYTGMYCIVLAPRQHVRNLPLAVPFLRGRRQMLLDHMDTVDMEESIDVSNLFPQFDHQVAHSRAELRGSVAKPKFQLVINYRESDVKAPSEVVINIGYDDDETCHLTFHNLAGELLHPPDPPPPINNHPQ
uniref:ATP-dependent zinc metalloprotease FtsH n=1 Tax=Lygus hesperus TaxID=30085 RepID=A0A0A9YVB1_LYGHE